MLDIFPIGNISGPVTLLRWNSKKSFLVLIYITVLKNCKISCDISCYRLNLRDVHQ